MLLIQRVACLQVPSVTLNCSIVPPRTFSALTLEAGENLEVGVFHAIIWPACCRGLT